MNEILEAKEKVVEIYAKYARWILIAVKFIAGWLVFGYINSNLGYMASLDKFYIPLGAALVCSILPLSFMIVAAAGLVLAHIFSLSIVMLAMVGVAFLLVFCFYFRFSAQDGILLLLTPVAFAFNVPYVIPVAWGLLGTPTAAMGVACGTFVYYVLDYVQEIADSVAGSDLGNMLEELTQYGKDIFLNKEMWLMILVLAVSVYVVYFIKRMPVDHAWKFAIAGGVVSNFGVVLIGGIFLDTTVSVGTLLLGNVVAVGVGFVLEFLFFAVDYKRIQKLQFEDDEYQYYVKAVPKLGSKTKQETAERHAPIRKGTQQKPRRVPNQVGQANETVVMPSERVEQELRRTAARQNRNNAHRQANEELLQQRMKDELEL